MNLLGYLLNRWRMAKRSIDSGLLGTVECEGLQLTFSRIFRNLLLKTERYDDSF